MKKPFTLVLISLIATSCSLQPNSQIESTTTPEPTIQSYSSNVEARTTDNCEQYLPRLQANDSTVVAALEKCLEFKDNAFKKFFIPPNANDYYAFLGNNSKEDDDIPVCNGSLQYKNCLLYKVIAGKPYLIANVSDTTSEPNLTSTFDKFGYLGQIVTVKGDSSAVTFNGLMDDLGYCWPKGCAMAATASANFSLQNIEAAFRSQGFSGKPLISYVSYEPFQGDLKTSYADLTFHPNPDTIVAIDLLIDREDTVQMKYNNKIIATLPIDKDLLQVIGTKGFLSLDDLKSYALSESLKQFHFSLGNINYILDFQNQTPKLLKK